MPHKVRQHAFVWLCILALAIAALAQKPAQKDEPPVLRVTSHLVLVSVIVQDKNGEAITDLKKEDFTLLEHGKEQVISTFALESSRSLPHSVSSLPPNTFTNRVEQRVAAPTSISVILLDGMNTAIQDQSYARDNIVKFLSQVQPQDRVAIYALGHGVIRIVHDFSSDPATLIAALHKQRGRLPYEVNASESQPAVTSMAQLDEFLADANQRMKDFYAVDRVLNTTNALEAVARHLARFPGRKNLIWVSSSFPIAIGMEETPTRNNLSRERRTFYAETERAARALSNANVAVYPVDARGILGSFPSAASGGPISTTRGGYPPPPDGMYSFGDFYSSVETMKILAEKTGGKAYYNRNDVDGAVRSAIEDSHVSYVIGYYPTHGKWDGRFVEIKLKLDRPGARIRYRKGYFAGAEPPLEVKEIALLLGAAAHSPLESTSVGMTVRAEEVPGAANSLKLSMDIDPHDINLVLQDDRWIGSLDFLFLQRNVEGRILSSVPISIGMQLNQETHAQLEKDGLTLSRTIAIDPSADLLRVVVRDARSGSIGTVSVPLKPNATKGGD